MSDIVVGVDGSPESATALQWAVDAAAQRHCAIRVIYALHMPLAPLPFDGVASLPPSEDLRKRAESLLTAVHEDVGRQAPGLSVHTELSLRPAAVTLLAASRRADLVVVGTRGSGIIGSAFLGSVSTRVAARAACPTVVVPHGSAPLDPHGPVLVGVDGSTHSAAAARFALDEARRRGSRMIALTAYSRPDYGLALRNPELAESLENDARLAASRVVTDVVEQARGSDDTGQEVEIRAVPGYPPSALVDAGRDAALTVVGSRGRGGFRGMVLGSVSQAVLHHSTHPVAVVHVAHIDRNEP